MNLRSQTYITLNLQQIITTISTKIPLKVDMKKEFYKLDFDNAKHPNFASLRHNKNSNVTLNEICIPKTPNVNSYYVVLGQQALFFLYVIKNFIDL